jgi:signal transduction histidine kinase
MRWPLRHQIIWPLVAVAAISLATVGVASGYLAAQRISERIDRQLNGVVAVLAASNFPLSDAVLRQMRELSGAEFVLGDHEGHVLTSSFTKTPPPSLSELPLQDLKHVLAGRPIEVNGAQYFHTAVELPRHGRAATSQRIHVFFPEDEYRRSWREAFLPPLIVGAVALSAVVLVASLLARRISRATARLGVEVLRMARGDFTPAELPATNDEIRDLSAAVNQTAEMLAQYEGQVRRHEQMRTVALLGAGLAHEMRNAATGCRIAIDLHAEKCQANGAGESLQVAKRQLVLMENQLRRFLRTGKPRSDVEKRTVDLRQLVEEILPLVQPMARHARVRLAYTPSQAPVHITADEEAIGQLALNLAINAIEAVQHSDACLGRVGVVVRAEGDTAELIVTDNGAGPAHSSEGTVFDPFVSSKPEGIGLGLTVAKEIVSAHHGTIQWNRATGETQFRVQIPLAVNEARLG